MRTLKPSQAPGLPAILQEPFLDGDTLVWRDGPKAPLNDKIIKLPDAPFQPTGGVRHLNGGLGQAVMKTSAVAKDLRVIKAPAAVFHDQGAVKQAFQAGTLNRDVVVVVRFQGPQANGMPELHGLTPILSVLLDRGHKVALLTDGRMSGASGKVPAAIHLCPEAAVGGPIAKVQDGDMLRVDAAAGTLDNLTEGWQSRAPVTMDLSGNASRTGPRDV